MPNENGSLTHPELNPRQAYFCRLYVYSEDAYQAKACAQKAGYSEKDPAAGWRLLRLPQVQAEIRRLSIARLIDWHLEQKDVESVAASIMLDPREEKAGGPTRMERLQAIDRIITLRGWKVDKTLHADVSLQQLLEAVRGRPAPEPPESLPEHLRLIHGGKK